MTKSSLIACITGSSLGFVPLRICATVHGTGLAIANGEIDPVAHETARTSVARRRVNGRNVVTRGKRPDFIAMIGEERKLTDNECHGLGIENSCECCFKLVFGGRCNENESQAQSLSRRNYFILHIILKLTYPLTRKVRDRRRLRHQLMEKIKPFA